MTTSTSQFAVSPLVVIKLFAKGTISEGCDVKYAKSSRKSCEKKNLTRTLLTSNSIGQRSVKGEMTQK